MSIKEIVKSLVLLQEKCQRMRENGESDLRGIIMDIEHLIMSIEN